MSVSRRLPDWTAAPDPSDPRLSDDEVETLEQWERNRQRAFRWFAVYIAGTEKVDVVCAHYIDNDNAAGHLNFMTILPDTRGMLTCSYTRGVWVKVVEIESPAHTQRPSATADGESVN